MAWKESAFGKILYHDFERVKYIRLPIPIREYFITTKGLVIRGGKKGPGDLLTWDRIKEPGSTDGLQILGLDIAGTIKFNTPITLSVIGRSGKTTIQEFPNMSSKFYLKLIEAWQIAQRYEKDLSMREKILTEWSRHNTAREESYYETIIYQKRINEIFKDQKMRQLAEKMIETGDLTSEDLKKGTNYAIMKKVKSYWEKLEKEERGIGFKNPEDFRNNMKFSQSQTNSGSRGHRTHRTQWSVKTQQRR